MMLHYRMFISLSSFSFAMGATNRQNFHTGDQIEPLEISSLHKSSDKNKHFYNFKRYGGDKCIGTHQWKQCKETDLSVVCKTLSVPERLGKSVDCFCGCGTRAWMFLRSKWVTDAKMWPFSEWLPGQGNQDGTKWIFLTWILWFYLLFSINLNMYWFTQTKDRPD